ncbi:MAG: CvpA family protein, partial [Clostridia bacterium]|nr:CvpA family protein [Clostridia bacterium]
MNIILDILAVAILALSIFFGHKKGFVKTVLNLCGGIICLIVAIVLSPTVGDFISTNYVTPTVENVVTEKMSALATVGDTNEPDVDKIVRDEPNEFIKLLERLNIDTEAFAEKFEEFKQSSAENTAELTVEYIAKPLSGAISYV